MRTPVTITSTGPVVTLFESYGSGAEQVGARVAELLGVKFLSQQYSSEMLEQASAQQQDSEDGFLMRFFKRFGQPTVEHLDNILIPGDQQDDQQVVLGINRTLLDFTAAGGVVLGRNGTVVLAGNPRALHVKLEGSVENRVARAAELAGIEPERAARRQVNEDEDRAAMALRLYNWDPRENQYYDLIISTDRLSVDAVAAIIVAGVKAKGEAAA
ncbi:MAG TPA: cytidylate kinase-like family protein [Micropruina sp.]|jgi:cytidylate kinase|nr:cytidylate kinase-like family protein [Micropruina sp.]